MQQSNYYLEIDEMPLHNWLKCQDGKLAYCRITWSNDEIKQQDADAWNVLQNDFIEKVGLGEDKEKYFKLLDKETDAICKYLETGNRALLNKVDQYRFEIDKIINEPVGTDIDELLLILGKWWGSFIRKKEITVLEFHNLIKRYGKENKQN